VSIPFFHKADWFGVLGEDVGVYPKPTGFRKGNIFPFGILGKWTGFYMHPLLLFFSSWERDFKEGLRRGFFLRWGLIYGGGPFSGVF